MARTRTTRAVPHEVSATIARARRRLGLGVLVGAIGPLLAAGGALASILVVVVKLWGSRLGLAEPGATGWSVVVAAPMLASLAWAGLVARRRWPSMIASASALDAASGTHDLLGSTLSIGSREHAGAFEQLTIRQSSSAAERATVKNMARIRFTPAWIVAAGSAALAGVLAWLAPMREPALPGPMPIVRTQSPEAAAEAVAKLEQAKEAIEAAASTGQVSDQQLAAIEELERELAEGLREPEDVVAAAAETLQRSAEEAAERAQREQSSSQSVRERLSSVEPGSFQSARQLAEDLAEGDLDAAAAEAERLLEEMQSAPEEEQRQLAQELRRLAEKIERAENAQPESEQSAQQAPPPESAPPEPTPSTDEIRKQLESEGVPPEEAQRLAEEIEQQQESRQDQQNPEPQSREDAERIAEELREQADELSPPEPQPESAGDQQGQDQQDQQPQGEGQEPQPQTQPKPANSPQGSEQGQGEQQGERQSQQEGQQQDQQGQRDDGQAGEQEGQQQSQQGQPQQGQPGQQEQPSSQSDQQPSQQPGQQSGQQPGQQQGEQGQPGQDGQPSGQPGEQPGGEQPSQAPGTQAGDQPGADPSQPGTGEGAQPGLSETLRQIADRQKSADDAADAARDLQRSADELTGQAPGGDDLRDATDRLGPGSDWQGQTQFVDARSQDEADPERESIIAEWFNPSATPDDSAQPGTINPSQVVRQAEQRARRALEQQAVPRRHAELIKRVFDRYAERAKEAVPPGGPPATDAEDAP